MVDARARGEIDVAAAPRDDDVRAHVEELAGKVPTPATATMRVALSISSSVRSGKPPSPVSSLPAFSFFLRIVLRDFGIEVADLELRDPVLLRELLDDRHELVDAAVAAGVAGRADDERNAFLARCREEKLELLAREVAHRRVLAEIDGARIGAAGVGHDVVGVRLFMARWKLPGFDGAVPRWPVEMRTFSSFLLVRPWVNP